MPKVALDALQNEVRSADAYGLQAGAEVLATAIGSDRIPVKLRALNVLVRVKRCTAAPDTLWTERVGFSLLRR